MTMTTLLRSLLVIFTDILKNNSICLSNEIFKHAKITQLLNKMKLFFPNTQQRELPDTELQGSSSLLLYTDAI